MCSAAPATPSPRSIARRWLQLTVMAALSLSMNAAPSMAGDPAEAVVEALNIRGYLLAAEAQCRETTQMQAEQQIAVDVAAALKDRKPDPEIETRLKTLGQTYAEEACRLGIDDGLIQGYRASYRAALSDAELNAALAFLRSPEGRKFVDAGLAANREASALIARRRASQGVRAATLYRTRLAKILSDAGAR
jgi:hypothetical protein